MTAAARLLQLCLGTKFYPLAHKRLFELFAFLLFRLHGKYLSRGGNFRDAATAAGIYQVRNVHRCSSCSVPGLMPQLTSLCGLRHQLELTSMHYHPRQHQPGALATLCR
jgi:hypothetical protein